MIDLSDRTLFSFVRLSSGFLLLVLLMVWSRYSALSLDTFLAGVANDDRVDATSVASGLSVVLAFAVIVLSGLFPALIWARPAITNHDATLPLWIPIAALLPATGLAGQLLPMSDVSLDGHLLLAAFGGLTLIAAHFESQ